jgi:hypothetical protein
MIPFLLDDADQENDGDDADHIEILAYGEKRQQSAQAR